MGLLQVIMVAVAVDDIRGESSNSCPILPGCIHDDDERLNING